MPARRTTSWGIVLSALAFTLISGAVPIGESSVACAHAGDPACAVPALPTFPGGQSDTSPLPCAITYPGHPADPDDDVPCAENMVHVFNDPFFGSDLDFLGKRLYTGSLTEGFRIYDLAQPAAPELIGRYQAASSSYWQADVDAFKLGKRTFVNLNMTDGQQPDVTGGRAEFVDVTDPAAPRLVATLWGDSHNGDIVQERGWYLPSRYTETSGDLEVYELAPLRDGSPPRLIECERRVPCHDPVALWQESPYRGSEQEGSNPTLIHDISIYPNHLGAGRDIALAADYGTPSDPSAGGIYVIDITDPSSPEVLERWSLAAPLGGYHEAAFVEGDPTLMVVVEENPTLGFCGSRVLFVRMSADFTEATTVAHWKLPPLGRLGDGVEGWADPSCTPHNFNTDGSTLYIGTHGSGGNWIVDLEPLRDVTEPPVPGEVPALADYFDDGAKPELGHYIPDSGGGWTAVHHKGLIYTTGGAHLARLRGLDVFEHRPCERC